MTRSTQESVVREIRMLRSTRRKLETEPQATAPALDPTDEREVSPFSGHWPGAPGEPVKQEQLAERLEAQPANRSLATLDAGWLNLSRFLGRIASFQRRIRLGQGVE